MLIRIDVCHSTPTYCVHVGGNIVYWKSKEQEIEARSSVKVKYQAMALITYGLIWIKQFIHKLKFVEFSQMKFSDNQIAFHITSNLIVIQVLRISSSNMKKPIKMYIQWPKYPGS